MEINGIIVIGIGVLVIISLCVIQRKLVSSLERQVFNDLVLGSKYILDNESPFSTGKSYTLLEKINDKGTYWVLLQREDGMQISLELYQLDENFRQVEE